MKRNIVNTLLVGAVVLLMGAMQSSAQQGANGESEVQRGFDIAPVPLDLAGKNRSLVGLGSYYVNGPSDCIGCHTGDTGHLGGGQDFGGIFTRKVIMPWLAYQHGTNRYLEALYAYLRSIPCIEGGPGYTSPRC